MREPVKFFTVAVGRLPRPYSVFPTRHAAGLGVKEAEAYYRRTQPHLLPVVVLTAGEIEQRTHQFMVALPAQRITQERFWEMLEVLPPKAWRTTDGMESFQMIEHYTDNWTSQYCRMGERYLTKLVDVTNPETHVTAANFDELHAAAVDEDPLEDKT